MTQIEASKASGIPQSTISTSERESHGSAETTVYAKIYGVNAHWLATGEGEMLPCDATIQTSGTTTATGTGSVISLEQALAVVAARLNILTSSAREQAAQHLQTLARAPDSKKAIDAVLNAMDNPPVSGLTPTVEKVLSERDLVNTRDFAPPPPRNDSDVSIAQQLPDFLQR